MATNSLALLETDTTRTLFRLLRNVFQRPCSQPCTIFSWNLSSPDSSWKISSHCSNINTEITISSQNHGRPKGGSSAFSEPSNLDPGIREEQFFLLAASCQIARRISAVKILLLFRIVSRDLARSNEFAFVRYTECTNELKSHDEILACVCPLWSTASVHHQI